MHFFYLWACVSTCICVYRCPLRAEEDVRSPEVGARGSCKLPSVSLGNLVPGLCKNSECL